MKPAARVQAAIEIIDTIIGNGFRAEHAFKTWERENRYAGSKDRAAIRDYVYDALRNLRTFAARGGSLTGRAIFISALREHGVEPDTIFTGERYAPHPLTQDESIIRNGLSPADTLNLTDWLWRIWKEDLDDKAEVVANGAR